MITDHDDLYELLMNIATYVLIRITMGSCFVRIDQYLTFF